MSAVSADSAEASVGRGLAGEAALRLTDVRFAWPGPSPFTLAIERFAVARGERLLLTGPSGSGKSTLLSLICGIVIAQAGHIELLGTDPARLSAAARDRFRATHFGVIFQTFNLLPYLSVLDNVLLPLRFSPERRARAGGAAAADEARRLLERLGLAAEGALGSGTAARLSVGQQQRVAAARALIGTPEIVIADEPTSALDSDRQRDFLELLFAEVERARASLVMVSHDPTLGPLFDRVVRLGDIAQIRHPAAVAC